MVNLSTLPGDHRATVEDAATDPPLAAVATLPAATPTATPTPTPTATPKPPEPVPTTTPEPEPTPTPRSWDGIAEGDVIVGELTHYDVCLACCGKVDGVTASGQVIANGVQPEIPVASCNWLPLGTLVEVGDTVYVIADRGGKGLDAVGRLDIFVPDGHQAALDLGRIRDVEITILQLSKTN